jgi:hypothetical protein
MNLPAPSSRSDAVKVAVGFNPRLAAETVPAVAERRLNAIIFSNLSCVACCGRDGRTPKISSQFANKFDNCSAGRASVWSAGACSRFWNAAQTGRAPPIPERKRQQVGALQTLARGKIDSLTLMTTKAPPR